MKHVTKNTSSANKTSGLNTRVTTSKNRYEAIHLGQIKAKLALIGWNLASYIEQSYYKANTAGFGLYQLVFRHKESNLDFIVVSGNNTESLAGIYIGLAGIPYKCLIQAKHDRSYTDSDIFEAKCLELAESVRNGAFQLKSGLNESELYKLFELACIYKQKTAKGPYCSFPELTERFSTIQEFFAWFFNPGNSKAKIDRITRIRDIAVNSYNDLIELPII